MSMTIHAQDANYGRLEVVAERLKDAFTGTSQFSSIEAAVAYASLSGVNMLLALASGSSSWRSARKRFLVSIDSGFTEPDALVLLAGVPNAEVRIPNAEAVLVRSRLRPVRPFHPKAYLVRDAADVGPATFLSGSANLTVSALTTGAEVVTQRTWKLNARSGLSGYDGYLNWFEDAWMSAVPVELVIDRYRLKRPAAQRGLIGPEDVDLAAMAYTPPPNAVVTVKGATAARLAVAKEFWIGAQISPNRGALPGNQLDTPRGSRVFFGYPATDVTRNSIFGDVAIRFGAGPYILHSLRFGNNHMDKVNLPIPGADGPTTYDGQFLLFRRDGLSPSGVQRFTLTLLSSRAVAARSRASRGSFAAVMGSGRRWGLFF